jgi:transposase
VERFCIPASKSAPFVHAMEHVLDVYHRPYDPRRPQVCVDETSKQLLEHVRAPLPPAPGVSTRVDDEYRRCGTANIFLAVEPLTGRVITEATERRTSVDFARFLRQLSDEKYPDAERIVLVMDNLSTHSLASLYEAFEPHEAHRLAERFELHFTPKHGSWLNVAEIQLSVLARQALDQRVDSLSRLHAILTAWHAQRTPVPVRWRFTTADARIKLLRLYPDTERAAAGWVGNRRAATPREGSGGERSAN